MLTQYERYGTISVGILLLAASAAMSDPPTPPPTPPKWELLESNVSPAFGHETVYVVIDSESISRHGDIISNVAIGTGFAQRDGHWTPGLGWLVVSYQIDCKYHTYNEQWWQNSERSSAPLDVRWTAIDPGLHVALAEKKLCPIRGEGR
jgi:hypothetical protein